VGKVIRDCKKVIEAKLLIYSDIGCVFLQKYLIALIIFKLLQKNNS